MSSKRVRTLPPPGTLGESSSASSGSGSTTIGGSGSSPVAAISPLAVGINGLPAAVLTCVLQCTSSRDLGALAGVSHACWDSTVRFMRTTRTITLDVCEHMFSQDPGMFGNAQRDVLRGCAIRGIRILSTNLQSARCIRQRGRDAKLIYYTEDDGATDASRIVCTVAAMVTRNQATLQEIELGSWCQSAAIMVALVNCRRLTALDIPDLNFGKERLAGAIETIVANNRDCLTKLASVFTNSATLAFAAAWLPLRELHVEATGGLDSKFLGACTTLERLSVGNNRAGARDYVLKLACDATAHAAPLLTRLEQLRIENADLYRPGVAWHFAPSLTSIVVRGPDCTLPAISGCSVASLKLLDCDATLVMRLVGRLGALRKVDVADTVRKPADFLPSLLGSLSVCTQLESLLFKDDIVGIGAPALVALVLACPHLSVLDVPVAASVRTRNLAVILTLTRARMRDLTLRYSRLEESLIRSARDHRLDCRLGRSIDGAREAGGERAAGGDGENKEEGADRDAAPLHLPHLVSLRVAMCTSELLRRTCCPSLRTLEVVGERVRLDDPLPSPALFPRLETLRTITLPPFAAAIVVASAARAACSVGGDHAHLEKLTLSRAYDRACSRGAGSFNGELLGMILDRCPGLAWLGFDRDYGSTPFDRVVAALAAARSRELSDEILLNITGLRARHPHLRRVDATFSETLDPRIAEALSDL